MTLIRQRRLVVSRSFRILPKYRSLCKWKWTPRIILLIFVLLFIPYFFVVRQQNADVVVLVEIKKSETTTNSFATSTLSTTKPTTVNQTIFALSNRERRLFRDLLESFPNSSLCPEVPSSIWIDNRNDTHFRSRDVEDRDQDESGDYDLDPDSDFGVEKNLSQINCHLGGWWRPIGCRARHSTAIIIPYRDRRSHLTTLLFRLHQVLQSQLISYRIFVVEQNGTDLFNKGTLFNAGYLYIRDHYGSFVDECLIFHDVDLIPEDARNLYTCPDPDTWSVRHMSPGVDKMNYVLPYPELVGGVLALSPSIYSKVNGYSNLFRGWGGEDDDMWYRLEAEKIRILRPPQSIGRYKMLPHPGRPMAANRWRLLRSSKRRYKEDGLSNAVEGKTYRIVSVRENDDHTHIVVAFNGSSPRAPRIKIGSMGSSIVVLIIVVIVFR